MDSIVFVVRDDIATGVSFPSKEKRVKRCVEQMKATENNNLILRMIMTEQEFLQNEMLSEMDDVAAERILVYLEMSVVPRVFPEFVQHEVQREAKRDLFTSSMRPFHKTFHVTEETLEDEVL